MDAQTAFLGRQRRQPQRHDWNLNSSGLLEAGRLVLGGQERWQLYLISLLVCCIKSEYIMAFDLVIREIRAFVVNHQRNSRGREEEIRDRVHILAYM